MRLIRLINLSRYGSCPDIADCFLISDFWSGQDSFQGCHQLVVPEEPWQVLDDDLERAKTQHFFKVPIEDKSAIVSLLREYLIFELYFLNWKKSASEKNK